MIAFIRNSLLIYALIFVFNSTILLAEDIKTGEDGEIIEEGMELTDGIGCIDDISFDEGWAIIDDMKFTIDEDIVLIDKNQENASRSIFVSGIRVVWKARGETTLIYMDHYPVDSTSESTTRQDDDQAGDTETTSSSGGSTITLGEDGVYRN